MWLPHVDRYNMLCRLRLSPYIMQSLCVTIVWDRTSNGQLMLSSRKASLQLSANFGELCPNSQTCMARLIAQNLILKATKESRFGLSNQAHIPDEAAGLYKL